MIVTGIVVLAAIGLFVSAHIYHEKHIKHEKMKCNITSGCNEVVTSKYSSLGPIPLEVLGILYYTSVVGLVFFHTFVTEVVTGIPYFASVEVSSILLLIGGVAALVSLVLTFIQFAVLKVWCEYCVTSAIVSLGIFAFEALPRFTILTYQPSSIKGILTAIVSVLVVFLLVYLAIRDISDRKDSEIAGVAEEELDKLIEERNNDN